MVAKLFLSVLVLGALCAARDISVEYLDNLLSDMNQEVRSMMKRSEVERYANVSQSRVYRKRTSPEILEIGMRSTAFALASERLAIRHNITRALADELLEERATPRPDFNANTICTRTITGCNSQSKYRTVDGSCNNLQRPDNGMAISRQDRLLSPVYANGIDTFRTSVTGEALLSPRIISLIVHPDKNIPHNYASMMIIGFGQFLDHDLTSTPENTNLACCQNRNNPECMAIDVPTNDDFYASRGITCLDIGRSVRACGSGRREQINQNSAFIDGNQIYGSTLAAQQDLRALTGGLMKTDTTNTRWLPKDTQAANCGIPQNGIVCFKAGDGRVNEQPGLTAMHTLFVREHNRIATGLKAINPGWNDETLFQETRRIVIAEIQNIVFSEFLPVVLGATTMNNNALNLPTGTGTTSYDSSVNPATLNEFSTAGFRFAHTLIQNTYTLGGGGSFNLAQNFQNPQVIYQNPDNVDRILLGMATQSSQDFDPWMADAVRNRLFQRPGADAGVDLASFNIQRGRDHGLPPYNDYLFACGGSRLNSFADLLTTTRDQEMVDRFQDAYRDVNDIDLWPGGISEWPINDGEGIVGPTFACIIARNFRRVLYGDRFFFTHANQAGSFTANQRANIRQRTLGGIMCDNSAPTVTSVRQNSFVTSGSFISCANTAKLNLQNWAA